MDPPIYSQIKFRHHDGTILSGTVIKKRERIICDVMELFTGNSIKINFNTIIQSEYNNITYIQDNKQKNGIVVNYTKYIYYDVNLDDPCTIHRKESCDIYYDSIIEQHRILQINLSS
jgi:hypothetical protein